MTCLLLSLFLLASVALIVFDLLVVLMGYSIYWYEYSNSNPNSFDQRFNRRSLSLCLSLILPEVFFNFVTLAAIPFGLFNKKNQDLQRGVTPVLLLHGLFDNQASWFWFKRQLKQQGIRNIVTLNLSSWHNEEVLTELLSKRVDELRHRLGVNRVHLVGHSMGGIIARNYVQLRGGEDKVEQLVCLGAPHYGSKLATFSISPLGKQLIPGSDFLQRLNSAPVPKNISLTNIYTKKDNMVIPSISNHLTWGEAIELDGMGHTSLIYRSAAINATAAVLKETVPQ
ncbi:MAG: lipase family protein [Deltaproteobacteria bacterium]|nr:lipase family protein [Deltaproteobacteria bacterium]MCW9050601.1 lipase family protein [Deltaproteobacteria bacterium]